MKYTTETVETAVTEIGSETARIRLGANKALRLLSEQAPELVYPYFDFVAGLLEHKNSFLRWNAMLVLANLAAVDREGKLDRMIDVYLAPISGPKLIDAANTIRGAGTIALAKPHLANKIVRRVLQVERASYATPECRNVAIGHAIVALGRFFPAIDDQRSVRFFVRRQLRNPRHAVRVKAEKFLTRWP